MKNLETVLLHLRSERPPASIKAITVRSVTANLFWKMRPSREIYSWCCGKRVSASSWMGGFTFPMVWESFQLSLSFHLFLPLSGWFLSVKEERQGEERFALCKGRFWSFRQISTFLFLQPASWDVSSASGSKTRLESETLKGNFFRQQLDIWRRGAYNDHCSR